MERNASLYYEEFDNVGYIIFNDPPENRMTLQFFSVLRDIVDKLVSKAELTGVILCSKSRHFSSGAALPELLDALENARNTDNEAACQKGMFADVNQKCFATLASLNVPVVAVLKGLCAGSAYELALCADIRIAEERTTLGLPEVQYGVIPGCGGTVRLTKLLGAGNALELIMSGQLLSADEAYDCGLVDMVVPRKQGVLIAEQLLNGGFVKRNRINNKAGLMDVVSQFVNVSNKDL